MVVLCLEVYTGLEYQNQCALWFGTLSTVRYIIRYSVLFALGFIVPLFMFKARYADIIIFFIYFFRSYYAIVVGNVKSLCHPVHLGDL